MAHTVSQSRLRSWRTRTAAVLTLVGAVFMGTGLVVVAGTASANAAPTVHKVFVCKYVGKPGVDERLQTGNNPISVDTNALEKDGFTAEYPSNAQFPFWFEDAQGRSVAFAWDAEQGDGQRNEPSIEDCPPAQGPTTVTPNVTFDDPECPPADGVGWTGAEVEGVSYAVTSGSATAGQSIVVTATAGPGFQFAGGATTQTFEHSFPAVPTDCGSAPGPQSVTVGASFTDPTCVAPGVAVALSVNGQPDGPNDHVSFAVQGTQAPGQAVTVVATPDAGYVISGASSFPHTFGAVPTDCAVETTPPASQPGEVLGSESVAPKPHKTKTKTTKPEVLGTEAAVPTAVDAGLGSLPAAAPAQGSLLGQLLVGAGVALMLAAGWLLTLGRKVGAREA